MRQFQMILIAGAIAWVPGAAFALSTLCEENLAGIPDGVVEVLPPGQTCAGINTPRAGGPIYSAYITQEGSNGGQLSPSINHQDTRIDNQPWLSGATNPRTGVVTLSVTPNSFPGFYSCTATVFENNNNNVPSAIEIIQRDSNTIQVQTFQGNRNGVAGSPGPKNFYIMCNGEQ